MGSLRNDFEWTLRVVDGVRAMLEVCGSPAYTAVALVGDVPHALAPLAVSSRETAISAAAELQQAHSGAEVLVVTREIAREQVRWTIWDAQIRHRRQVRVESLERTIADNLL